MLKSVQWLIDRPEFLSNEVYIAGDSYCRIPVLVIVKEISIQTVSHSQKGQIGQNSEIHTNTNILKYNDVAI